MSNEKLTLTIPEVAELLGITLGAAYTLARRADFPVLTGVKRPKLVNRKKLDEWVDRHTNEAHNNIPEIERPQPVTFSSRAYIPVK